MGFARARVYLTNPRRPDLAPFELDAPADSGANWSCIPEQVAVQLQLDEQQRREVILADGRHQSVPYVGPIEIRLESRLPF